MRSLTFLQAWERDCEHWLLFDIGTDDHGTNASWKEERQGTYQRHLSAPATSLTVVKGCKLGTAGL